MSPLQYLYSEWNVIPLLINNLEIGCKSCLHAIYSYFISGKVGVKQVHSAFSGKLLHGSRETLPWHLIPALRNHILGKGNQIDSLFRVFPKMTFSGAQGLARLKNTSCILLGNSKWQKPNLTNHCTLIRHYKPDTECSSVNKVSKTLVKPVGLKFAPRS